MSASISIVGGLYGEECAFPRRRIYRGSGGRASAILSSLGLDVTLHTVVGAAELEEISRMAAQLGFALEVTPSGHTIWFRYRFPLGQPSVYPSIGHHADQPVLRTENALVFGMLEGRRAVHARRVVYDPQDGHLSRPFHENGSTASELAQVVSWSEGKALTGFDDPYEIASKLLSIPGASVAIVKCGPQGALVCSAGTSSWVASFPTTNVYKIGSGDIFSAVFAYAWLTLEMGPVESAWFASRVTAYYVERASDRIPEDVVKQLLAEADSTSTIQGSGNRKRIPDTQIYLAGPFFNTGQQWIIDETRGALLDMGFKVFSPIHDVGEGVANDIASRDLEGLDASGIVLAIVDGCDVGTIFEVGYARAKGIPVVAVAEDVPSAALTMLEGSGCQVVGDLTTGIYKTCWKLMDHV